eukprot:112414_1
MVTICAVLYLYTCYIVLCMASNISSPTSAPSAMTVLHCNSKYSTIDVNNSAIDPDFLYRSTHIADQYCNAQNLPYRSLELLHILAYLIGPFDQLDITNNCSNNSIQDLVYYLSNMYYETNITFCNASYEELKLEETKHDQLQQLVNTIAAIINHYTGYCHSSFSNDCWCPDNVASFPLDPNIITLCIDSLPTLSPTQDPTNTPSNIPSHNPTQYPSDMPTKSPSGMPTNSPIPFTTIHGSTTLSPTYYPSITALFVGKSYIYYFVVIISSLSMCTFISILIYLIACSGCLEKCQEIGNGTIVETLREFSIIEKVSLVTEIADVVTDYIFGFSLIIKSRQSEDTIGTLLGWMSLLCTIIGSVIFYIRFILAKKLIGFQTRNLKKQFKHVHVQFEKLESPIAKLKSHALVLEMRKIRMYIDLISMLITCLEDVPQLMIVYVVVIAGNEWTEIRIVTICVTITSILLRICQVLMAKFGCKDPDDLYDGGDDS